MTKMLGKYEIIEQIGQGGFAIVYRARDVDLDRQVALKELRPVLFHDADWVRRFRREARTIARLEHPHIVSIYDVLDIDERLFLVMRLVDGPALDESISAQKGGQKGLPWSDVVEIIKVVSDGLDYAYNKGVLHRDLKPGNILMDSERGAMLVDFGLAKLVGENSMSVTSGGGVVGTPHYIAPEVWEVQGTTRQSDIYALGCIVYEMVMGEKLIKGETPPQVMMSHFKPLVLPETWPEGVPAGIREVLYKALAADPSKRYASAGEMAQELAALAKTDSAAIKKSPAAVQQTVEAKQLDNKAGKVSDLSDDKGQIVASAMFETPPPFVKKQFKPEAQATHSSDYDHLDSDSFSSDNYSELPAESGQRLSGKWRGFLNHLGPYAIVMGMLFFIYAMTDFGGYPWFVWPAMGWGVGLAFHFMGVGISELKGLSAKWKGLASHLGSYAIVMGMLFFIYAMSDFGGYPWFVWPAGVWGAALAIHFWSALLMGGKGDEQQHERQQSHQEEQSGKDRQEWGRRRGSGRGRERWRARHRQPEPEKGMANATIEAHLQKAQTYQKQIDQLIKSTSDKNTRARLQELGTQVGEWTKAIEELAERVDRFQQNSVIHQDLESVPRSIKKLEAQLAQETDEITRAELERTLTNRKNQLAALEHLKNSMKRAEIKIESTLSSLGTIYSQILTSQSTDHVADYGRLSAEADEEVRTLQDHLDALEEVKLGRVS